MRPARGAESGPPPHPSAAAAAAPPAPAASAVAGRRMARNGESWESLKARAKGLQGELDAKLQELERLNKRLSSSSASSPGDRVATLDGQIRVVAGLREDVERGLADLAEATETLANVAATGAQAAQATRFRDTHQDLSGAFKRVVQRIDHQYQHARLLPKRQGTAAEMDSTEQGLVRERSSLNSTLSMTEEIIGQASATREMLSGQRITLAGARGKMGTVTSMLPNLSALIGRISDRQTKERIVLSVTVAGCCFFTLWYKFL